MKSKRKNDGGSEFPEAVEGLPALVPAALAAEFLSVTDRTIRRWSREGRIRTLRTTPSGSGRVLIPRVEILRLLGSMEEVPALPPR